MKLFKLVAAIAVLVFATQVFADDDPIMLYRFDSRSPSDVFFHDGFPSWGNDEDLARHVSGASINDRSSIYVSTTHSLNTIERMAREFFAYDPARIYYVYEIRPTGSFYDIRASLLQSSLEATNREVGSELLNLYLSFEWQEEWASRGGITTDQITAARSVTMQDGQVVYGPRLENPNYVSLPSQVNHNLLRARNATIDTVTYSEGEGPFYPVSVSFSDDCGSSGTSKRSTSPTYCLPTKTVKFEDFRRQLRRAQLASGLLDDAARIQ